MCASSGLRCNGKGKRGADWAVDLASLGREQYGAWLDPAQGSLGQGICLRTDRSHATGMRQRRGAGMCAGADCYETPRGALRLHLGRGSCAPSVQKNNGAVQNARIARSLPVGEGSPPRRKKHDSRKCSAITQLVRICRTFLLHMTWPRREGTRLSPASRSRFSRFFPVLQRVHIHRRNAPPEKPGGAQAADKVASHKKRAVFLGNIVTKNPVDQLNAELFKILRLRCASLRMTESEFVYSLRPSRKAGRGASCRQSRFPQKARCLSWEQSDEKSRGSAEC